MSERIGGRGGPPGGRGLARRGWRGMAVVAASLLLWGAAPPPPDAPVADAAMREDVAAVRALLQQGADVNAAQGDGMTALHWAAEHGHADMAGMLLYAGARL
ncbi:MAG: ankyrin repeat domain-containing protein, partial [Gemmatimonadota bacterium]